jgi:hypothetical protein
MNFISAGGNVVITTKWRRLSLQNQLNQLWRGTNRQNGSRIQNDAVSSGSMGGLEDTQNHDSLCLIHAIAIEILKRV